MNRLIEVTRRIFQGAQKILGIKQNYKIGDTYIKLSADHRLPVYQSNHPYYDRFLPHLAKFLMDGSVVVDVGANVGDTFVGMWDRNPNLKFVCVEADLGFYKELRSNIDRIVPADRGASVYPINQFVGSEISNVSLVGSGGTKRAVEGSGGIVAVSLDNVLEDLDLSNCVSLLKTDVDGFDYDVIRSASSLLIRNTLIYFECDYENDKQLGGYKNLISELINYGYGKFVFFDNFGQLLGIFSETKDMYQLLDYVRRQNERRGTRTFYYYDILAYSLDNEDLINEVIASYLET